MKRNLLSILILVILLSFTASASDLLVININNSENITFLNHSSSVHGNWINLTGGNGFRIPVMTFNYTGTSPINYTSGSTTINITSPTSYEFIYPFTVHQMYLNNSNVTATFYNSSEVTYPIDIYLTETPPTKLNNVFSNLIEGKTAPFWDMIDNHSVFYKNNPQLSNIGNLDFGAQTTGEYVIFILRNDTNRKNISIVSFTPLQVLEYNLTAISAPDSVQKAYNSYKINLSMNSTGGNYTYVSILIHNDNYKTTLRLKNNGKKAGINLTANEEFLVNDFKIAGVGINNVNQTTVTNIANALIGTNGSIVYERNVGNQTTISFTTDNLKIGKYILTVGVWSNKTGEKLVGFYQKEFEVTAPPCVSNCGGGGGSPGSGGGGGGGGGSPENYSNIILIEKYDLVIYKDKTTSYLFSDPRNPIIYNNITGNINAGDITVSVDVLKGKSVLAKIPAPEIVYQYLNIWVGSSSFATPQNIKEAVLTFKVNNSWFPQNKRSSSDIRMLRWDGSQWVMLETREISKGDDFTFFEARTNAFSPFAISGINGEELPVPTPEVIAKTVETNPTPTAVSKKTPVIETKPPISLPAIPEWVYQILIAAIIISFEIYFFVIRNRGKK